MFLIILKAAFFIDVGNVWLLRPNDDFSEGEFRFSRSNGQKNAFYDQLAVDIQHAENVRPNRVTAITIYYKNNGLIDLPVPFREFISLKGAPLGFTPEELDEGIESLTLELKEEGGPPNILRPGASGRIVIYTKSIAPIEYILLD